MCVPALESQDFEMGNYRWHSMLSTVKMFLEGSLKPEKEWADQNWRVKENALGSCHLKTDSKYFNFPRTSYCHLHMYENLGV